jgi:glucosamine-6-phosphate deaminase
MATIFDSKSVLLLASGTNKAGAVAAAVEDDVSESMPASMLRSHPNSVLFLDEAAASDLGHGVAGEIGPLLYQRPLTRGEHFQ